MNNFAVKLLVILATISVSLFLIQCSNGESDSDFEQERSEMISQLEDLRDDMDEELETMSQRIERAGDEVDEDLEAAYDELRGERSALDRTISNVERSTEETWGIIKDETSNWYEDITSRLDI